MKTPPQLDALFPEMTAIRRDIHAHPELAFKETRTATLVADKLRSWGVEVHTGIGQTGVVGVIRKGKGKSAIGLRADMDALPVQEANTFAHRSTIPKCMHACGHDGHTAMLLGAARYLAEHGQFNGTVYVIFQPAEEGEGGARAMIEDGLFERFPMDAIYGLHNWPGLAVGQFAVHEGAVMASTDRIEIQITGSGAHGAMPHLGRDPVVAGCALVQSVQSIVSRNLAPGVAGVISITQFRAGDVDNVIPETAWLGGTLRAFSSDVRQLLGGRLRELCAGIAATYGVDIDLILHAGYPPTVNHAAHAKLCVQAAGSVVGMENVQTHLAPSMGAEDFAYFLQYKPGCYIWIGNGEAEGGCTLHNPHYDFNDAIIGTGVRYWVALAQSLLV